MRKPYLPNGAYLPLCMSKHLIQAVFTFSPRCVSHNAVLKNQHIQSFIKIFYFILCNTYSITQPKKSQVTTDSRTAASFLVRMFRTTQWFTSSPFCRVMLYPFLIFEMPVYVISEGILSLFTISHFMFLLWKRNIYL